MPVTIDQALTVHPLILTRQSDYPLPAKPKSYTLKELRENFRCNEDMSADEVLQKAGELGHAFFHRKQDDRYYSFVPKLGNDEEATIAPPSAVVDSASRFVHLELEPLPEEDLEELEADLDEESDGEEDSKEESENAAIDPTQKELEDLGIRDSISPDVEYEFTRTGEAIPVTPETSAPLNLQGEEANPLGNLALPDDLDF